jgi:hypothetical protein
MKIRTRIAVFLSSLILVSIGHNIVPHHHHLDDILAHAACHQQEAALKGGKLHDHFGDREDPCQHCHAFNGLNYLISFNKDTRPIPVKIMAGNCPQLTSRIDYLLPGKYLICPSGEPIPYFRGFLIETSGFRAPPHSV